MAQNKRAGRPAGSKRTRPGAIAYESGQLPPGELTFEVASDWLHDSHEKLARVLGRDPSIIPRMRMAPDSSGFRPPPSNWEKLLAGRAAERMQELHDLQSRLLDQAEQKAATSGSEEGG